jgi:hypothetical protein
MLNYSVVRMAAVCLLAAASAFAQDASSTPPATVPAPASTQPASQQPVADYAWVRNAHSHANAPAVGLGDRLIVEVEHFPKLYAEAGGNCSGIVLFLDTLPMGLTPESCDVQGGTVRYLLERNDKNDSAWHWLLGNPRGFIRKIRVSVGTGDVAISTKMTTFPLRVIPPIPFFIWLALTFAGAILFVNLCRNTGLIRGGRTSALAPAQKPYSLAQFQMAFWFFLVIAAYVFMWMVTGELDTITESILALIGIGAGTALGSAMIDSSSSAASADNNVAASETDTVTRGFFQDVLNDGGGISFHRFQMFVWTLVLGVIFCASVYRHLAMPAFSATLLGLMGVSSGTYLGFKFPEKTNREAVQTTANNAATDAAATTPPG